MKPSIFVINLDRRPDRLAFMQRQLDGFGLSWEQFAAHDLKTVDRNLLAREVKAEGHRIGMGLGSQCCALTNLDIYRRIVRENLSAALVLQDDVELSQDIVPFVNSLDWLPHGVEVVQFEKYGRKTSKRLIGPSLGQMPVSGKSLHRLYSRTAGAACYLITQEGAKRILGNEGQMDTPIDHFLFSPNVSPVFKQLGVSIVRPALARQRDEQELSSDITSERSRRQKSFIARLRRLWQDVNQTPSQLIEMVRGARWRDFGYQEPSDGLK